MSRNRKHRDRLPGETPTDAPGVPVAPPAAPEEPSAVEGQATHPEPGPGHAEEPSGFAGVSSARGYHISELSGWQEGRAAPETRRVWCGRNDFDAAAQEMAAMGFRLVCACRDDYAEGQGTRRGYATFWQRG